ncbi:Dephospho-CoA kinase, partial [hydrothermal vent metagenome]
LRKIAFADPAQRLRLEAILHPRIRERAIALTEQAKTPYCVLVIPLLAETARDYPLDRILVIDTPVETQRQRVKARDRLSDSEIGTVLKTQASREERLLIADDVITNDGGLEALKKNVARLHQLYLKLALKGL